MANSQNHEQVNLLMGIWVDSCAVQANRDALCYRFGVPDSGLILGSRLIRQRAAQVIGTILLLGVSVMVFAKKD